MQITDYLTHIDPANLSYNEWVSVGMALHYAGASCDAWDNWSARDAKRYKPGDCAAKWAGFRGSANPVTEATIAKLARDQGYTGPGAREDYEIGWNDTIRDDYQVVDPKWLEGVDVETPGDDWEPWGQLVQYLSVLFQGEEHVGYVTQARESDGKPISKGAYDRTASVLIDELTRYKDVEKAVGTINTTAGAWIRFNPLDGLGVKDANITDYRYALVESDSVAIERQRAIYEELELPIAAMVHSGNKSLHAIVRIDAGTLDEYRKRVDFLYDVCRKNGLDVDQQNRNPSRLSRMPGVTRGENKQSLVATNIGKKSWNEWREWIEAANDTLPDPECLADVWDKMPPLADPLIDGVLRQGHKMLLAGPSKAGKSFALIEMCIAIAEGRQWLDWQCAQGRVLYVNLELDKASAFHRFKDVYRMLGWEPDNFDNIDIWNLRGQAVPMDKLAPKLIRRAHKKKYIAVVIDPIYKVITGDENAADKMAQFCNHFDKVCHELQAAVIYCHHHSKGQQGGKRSMDRASGSGVFARDPDALLDLIELEVTDDMKKVYHGSGTAWRIDGTMREFARFEPVNIWFEYPIHRVDNGILDDAKPPEPGPAWERGKRKREAQGESGRVMRAAKLSFAFEALAANGPVSITDLANEIGGPAESGVRRWIKENGEYEVVNSIVTRIENDDF